MGIKFRDDKYNVENRERSNKRKEAGGEQYKSRNPMSRSIKDGNK